MMLLEMCEVLTVDFVHKYTVTLLLCLMIFFVDLVVLHLIAYTLLVDTKPAHAHKKRQLAELLPLTICSLVLLSMRQ